MTLNYFYHKSSHPVIALIHGFLGNARQWEPIIEQLHRTHSLLLIELPGHGDSPVISIDFTIETIAKSMNQILEKEAIDKVHIIGHSMGGYVGAAFAAAYPYKMLSLTLLNSVAGADSTARRLLRNRAIALIEKYKDAYVSMAVSNLFTAQENKELATVITAMKNEAHRISLKTIVQCLKAMRDRPSNVSFLKNASFNVQYIYGDDDQVIHKDLIITEAQSLKVPHLSVNGGHMLLITHPDQVLLNLHFID